jgi:hypothetical protein
MSAKIDDPLEASLEAWPKEPEGYAEKFGELALKFGGLYFSSAAILAILKDQFLPANRIARLEYFFDGMVSKLKLMESESADREKLKEAQVRLEASAFQKAVATACEEAVRATDKERIEQFAAVLVGSLVPSRWADPNADVAALIRDLAQLGTEDIRALDVLRTAFADVIAQLPNLNDPNQFTERMEAYRSGIGVNHFDPEDFYAACARLNGFGLAIEVLRSTSRMHLHEYLFRPTRRGLALLDYLERFRSSERRQSA